MSVDNLNDVQGTISVVDSTPTFPKVINIVSGGTTISGVKGVKGSAEEEYREGYVNISPENLGFSAVEIESGSGTLSEKKLSLLKDNIHNYISYSPDGENNYLFKLISQNENVWTYCSTKRDLTGNMLITVNISTGEYLYSYVESSILEELTTHINNQDVHFREGEKEEVEEAVEQVAEQVNQVEETVSQLEETINSLAINGGEIE